MPGYPRPVRHPVSKVHWQVTLEDRRIVVAQRCVARLQVTDEAKTRGCDVQQGDREWAGSPAGRD